MLFVDKSDGTLGGINKWLADRDERIVFGQP